jgi:peptidoglycan/xylan/chitin deacetylase (PgdA/CDA1 family)
MVRLALRLFPILALGLGSWLGLVKPPVEALQALHVSFPFPLKAAPAPHQEAPRDTDRLVPSVDARLLPDPNPWPALNTDATVSRAWLLSEGPLPAEGSGRRVVTLTFDDGPFPETTPVVLHVLEKHHVHATFFWIGRYLDGSSDRAVRTRKVALDVRDAGHLIGTHTHDHERLTGVSHSEVLAQIDRGMSSIERAVGVRPAVFRPPFGQLDAYGETLWNIETQDLHHTDADSMARNIEEQIEFSGGGVVLLHDIRFSTAETTDKLLTWLDHHRYDPAHPANVGYDVVDFAEFTRATAASPQPYLNRAALEEARALAWRKQHPARGVPVAASDEVPLAM